jgi:acyl-CoA thioester hydrolase
MAQPVSVSVTLKVPYYDVDLMQIVWHGNYLKYFEVARQALFKKYGVDMRRYTEDSRYVFPVVRSMIKHIWPLRFDDEFICTAVLKEARVKIVLDFEIKLTSNGKVCAKGWTEQVAVLLPEMEMSFQIPEEIQKALSGDEQLNDH